MSRDGVLSEFGAVGTEEWLAGIREDLKGADPATLVWHAEEGLDLKPFYRAEDVAGPELSRAGLDALPGEFPYLRGTRAAGGWRIREEVEAADGEDANRSAREAVAAGAEEIGFRGAEVQSAAELTVLLAGLDEIPVRFEDADERLVRLLLERLKKRPHGALVSAGFDARGDFAFAAEVVSAGSNGFVPFTIRAVERGDRGAGAAERVGSALAAGTEFLAEMRGRGVGADRAAESISFSFAMGPEFLIEIAKLRAFRMLWAQAAESFGVSQEHAKARIYARTTRRDAAAEVAHMNILRGTTEAMSAVLGGADSICVAPFYADEPGRRLARNTQIILKREAHLARVADAAGGSYAVEAITEALVRREQGSGFREQGSGFRVQGSGYGVQGAGRRSG